jgi:hypothetical protein
MLFNEVVGNAESTVPEQTGVKEANVGVTF